MADQAIDFGININADVNQAIAAFNRLDTATRDFVSKATVEFAGIAIEEIVSAKVGFVLRSLGEITGSIDTFTAITSEKLHILQRDVGFVIPEDFRGKALQAFTEFDSAVGKVGTLTKEADLLGSEMRKLSGEFGYQVKSAELLKGAYDVVSSGFAKTADAVEVTKQATVLARGGFAETKSAIDVLTSALNAYGQGSGKAAEYADQLIQTQNLGKLTIGEYATSLGRAVTIAAQAGIKFEELNAIVAVATNKGLRASEAITGVRQAIANTLKPASDSADYARTLGIEFNAAALQTKGLVGIIKELNARGLDTPEVFVKLFGTVEAVSALLPSTKSGLQDVEKAMREIKNSGGAAAEALKSVSNTFESRVLGLKQGLSEGFIGFGKAIADQLKPLITEFDG